MAGRMTFEEFAVDWRPEGASPDEARSCMTSRPGISCYSPTHEPITLDEPPPDYDVDDALYRMQQTTVAEKAAALAKPATAVRVVAEGDSWFVLPDPVLGRRLHTQCDCPASPQ